MYKSFLLILAFSIASLSNGHAAEKQTDHLRWLIKFKQFNSAEHGFCNLWQHFQKLPLNLESCTAVIVMLKSPTNLNALENGNYGKVRSVQDFVTLSIWNMSEENDGSREPETTPLPPETQTILVITEVTIEQLRVMRYDSQILKLAPDAPMGPAGGVSSAGGGTKDQTFLHDQSH